MKIKKSIIRNIEISLLITYLVFVIFDFKNALLPMPLAISMVLLIECLLDYTGNLSYVNIGKPEHNDWMKNEEVIEDEKDIKKEETKAGKENIIR